MNILLIGPLPPLRGGISDFNKVLLKNLSKIHKIEGINRTETFFSLEQLLNQKESLLSTITF